MPEIYIVCFTSLEHTTNMMISRTRCIAVSVIMKLLKILGESLTLVIVRYCCHRSGAFQLVQIF